MKLTIGGLPRVLPLVAVAVAAAAPKLANCASVTERYEYHDNPAIWVMGQVSKVTCVSSTEGGCSNTVVAEAGYDPAMATQLTFKSFGKLQQTLTYYGDGSVKTVKDGNNNVTTLGDWYRGVPRSVTFADTKTQKAVVNDQGWIRAITDENNYRTCYDFDAMGRLKKTTYPSESTADTCDATTWNETIITYAQVATAEYGIPAGHWRQTVQTGNGYKFTYFDGQWRPLVVREYDSGNVPGTQRFQRFAYDHEGRVTFEAYPGTSDGLTSGKRTIYDPLGRVTRLEADSELGVLATTTEYLTGFQTRVTDPRNYKTTTSFVVYDQPKEEVLASIVHPEGAFTDFTRDAYGKALSIVRRDSGSTLSATRTYQYNAYQELCKVVEPETGATLTGYDGAGNVKWSAAGLPSNQACEAGGTTAAVAARRVDRKYDSRNRLWTLEFPDGNGNQTWTYTDDGKPKTVTTANPSLAIPSLITFTYFLRGLPKSEANVISPTTYTTSWTYNANGHLLSQTYPSSLNVAYAPNALGQPTQAGSFATAVSYYPNGAIKAFTYGNGVLHSMTQNARQLPSRSTDCKVSGTCAVADMRLDLSYVYDKAGNITSITDGENGRQTRGMTYDGLQRLKTVSSTMFGAATYGYNQLDDLRQVTIAAGSQVRDHRYCYNATTRRLMTVRAPGSGDECTGTIVQSLAYDVQGNIKTLGSQALVFDFGNRLREATGKENYAYDGFGHRVSSCETNGDCAHWVYSSKGRLEYSHDARNNKRVDHIYLGTSLVAQRERTLTGSTATNRYQHTDMLGSPISVTGADKAYLNKYEYEPYGLQVNGTLQDGPGYTGHVQDAATKLTYMQQRYYEPSIGRFLSIDPVTTDAKTGSNFNRYIYGNNNPYKFKDPDGRFAETLWDIASLALSVNEFSNNPSIGNALGVAIDAAAVIVPGIPGGVGAIRAADKAADAVGAVSKVEKTASGKRVGDFTRSQKDAAKAENAAANGGQMKCTDCGKAVESIKSEKGVSTPSNQAQVHHDPAIQNGGGQHSTPVVVCPDCHKQRHANE
ncbi:MAG: RHS repeat-associated core domain-containing protein [Burkholderiales bacterium]|nr:RHS repeat-associated core domain-containing protein [Burkholderiales bacterium]